MKLPTFNQLIKNRKDYNKVVIQRSRDISGRIAEMLIEARIIKNLSQEDIARILGTKQPAIARLENGSTLPSISTLVKLANALDTYLIAPKFAFMDEIESRYELEVQKITKIQLNENTIELDNIFIFRKPVTVVNKVKISTENTNKEQVKFHQYA